MNANESNVLCRLSINDYGIRFVLRSLQLLILESVLLFLETRIE